MCIQLVLVAPRSRSDLCDVQTRQTVVILDVKESIGNETGQGTSPAELPVEGTTEEILLKLRPVPGGHRSYFSLNGKKLEVTSPLDRDQHDLTSFTLQVECAVRTDPGRRRNIPAIVRISDENDNAPQFVGTPYSVSISELTLVGAAVFRGLRAVDADAGVNGLVEYSVVSENDPFLVPLPHQGLVTLARPLDYEERRLYLVAIRATDKAARPEDRLSATATLTVHVEDGDDLDPAFVYPGCSLEEDTCVAPEYSAEVPSGVVAGVLDVRPGPIRAQDRDSLNASVAYALVGGSPSDFRRYFEVDAASGRVRQVQPVERARVARFDLLVRATELTDSRRHATARLRVRVSAPDLHAPVLSASSPAGFVEEASPAGSPVRMTPDPSGAPLRLAVSDLDLFPDDPAPRYAFEVSSDLFAVDRELRLVTSTASLDRDPPNPPMLQLQVIAREVNGSGASEPVHLTVHLIDVNDNPPALLPASPVFVSGGLGRRFITQVAALDPDEGANARLRFSLHRVSGAGAGLFQIDPDTGVLEALGYLNAGESYAITVQVTDGGGLHSRSTLQLHVVRNASAPGQGAPAFPSHIVDVKVSEGAEVNSTVVLLDARNSGEGDVRYALRSGNEARHFGLDGRTGLLYVRSRLDRESRSRYALVVVATGRSGGATATATVSVAITDVNDCNPEFVNFPYRFQVPEGLADAFVGKVKAVDADAGANGQVYYSAPADSDFAVDALTGELRTARALDREGNPPLRTVVITARDGGAPVPRIGTCTVTVDVLDVEDELPIFAQRHLEATALENRVGVHVASAVATDPDLLPSITYVLRSGAPHFSVDPASGDVLTSRPLDFERESVHVVVVGTLENPSDADNATAVITVRVQDENDVAPTFPAASFRVPEDAPVGTTLGELSATDGDGTPPGNTVNYEVIGGGKAAELFAVHRETGVLSAKRDLRADRGEQYLMAVRAYDLGSPSLSATATVTIVIERHDPPGGSSPPPPPPSAPPQGPSLAFGNPAQAVQVSEAAAAGSPVVTLRVFRTPEAEGAPFSCHVVAPQSGGDDAVFSASVTTSGDCEVRTGTPLDRERQSEHNVTVALVAPDRGTLSTAQVLVRVADENDHGPRFVFSGPNGRWGRTLYLRAVSDDVRLSSPVVQVRAEDADSGPYGRLSYSFLLPTKHFDIDADTGVISVARPLGSVPREALPFNLTVLSRDSPGAARGYRSASASVLIDVIKPGNRLVLEVPGAPLDGVLDRKYELVRVLEEHTRCIVGVEKIEEGRGARSDGSAGDDSGPTLVWLYVIDPVTYKLYEREHPDLQRKLIRPDAQSDLLYFINGNLGIQPSQIRGPPETASTIPPRADAGVDGLQASLIALACLIAVLGVLGIVYVCVHWSRYRAEKDSKPLFVLPQYENLSSSADPAFLKEYETQVLQMSVPLEDGGDAWSEFGRRKLQAVNPDQVGYISRKELSQMKGGGELSRSRAAAAATARGEASMTPRRTVGAAANPADGDLEKTLPALQHPGVLKTNPLYQRTERGATLASTTNANVLFRDCYSTTEASTEL